MPDQIARRDRERRIRRRADLVIALAPRLVADPGIDVAGRPRHVPRTHRLDPRRLHRLEDVARHRPLRQIARVHLRIVEPVAQRKAIRRSARQQHLLARHPPAHLWQAQRIRRHPRRIDRERHGQFRIVRHDLRGLGERLLERIGGVVRGLLHAPDKPPAPRRDKREAAPCACARCVCENGPHCALAQVEPPLPPPPGRCRSLRPVPHPSPAEPS